MINGLSSSTTKGSAPLVPYLASNNSTHFLLSQPISLKFILMLSYHFFLGIPYGSFLRDFPINILYTFTKCSYLRSWIPLILWSSDPVIPSCLLWWGSTTSSLQHLMILLTCLDTVWSWVVSFMLRLFYCRVRASSTHWIRMGGHQGQLDMVAERNPCPS